MVGGSIRGLVLLGMCAAAVLVADERGLLAAPPAAGIAARVGVVQRAPAAGKPVIRGSADAARAWLGAEHRGLRLDKFANRKDGSLLVELRFRHDYVAIAVDNAGGIIVSRGGRRLRVDSPEAFEQLQQVLAGSEAVFAARVLLAEREAVSDLQAPEMSLLSTTAFVASLAGDLDAPRRVGTRFEQKHRGIYRQVKLRTCFDSYVAESSDAWNDMQGCMDEANQDASIFGRAYRRVACNALWLVRSESAWVEYLGCLGAGSLIPQ
jgi:hypothetical protein